MDATNPFSLLHSTAPLLRYAEVRIREDIATGDSSSFPAKFEFFFDNPSSSVIPGNELADSHIITVTTFLVRDQETVQSHRHQVLHLANQTRASGVGRQNNLNLKVLTSDYVDLLPSTEYSISIHPKDFGGRKTYLNNPKNNMVLHFR